MGRPLNKKYFGGRNAGITGGYNRSVDSTSGLAGTSVNAAGVTVTTVGSYTTAFPALTFAAPTGGEGITTATATGTFVGKVISATVSGTQSGTYHVGDLLTFTTAYGTATAYVATLSGSNVATVNFTGTGASAGSFTGGSTGGQATTLTTTQGSTGAGVLLTVTYGMLSATITNSGAGYAPSQAPVAITASSGSAAATITLEAEVTSGYSSTSDYPSIVAYAITTGTTSRRYSDIVKQEGSRSFRVVNTDSKTYPGTFCKLITATPTVAGTMAINATDSDGNTYWVEKLSNRKATIVSGGVGTPGTQFTAPTQVPWTFGSAVANVSVKIDNI